MWSAFGNVGGMFLMWNFEKFEKWLCWFLLGLGAFAGYTYFGGMYAALESQGGPGLSSYYEIAEDAPVIIGIFFALGALTLCVGMMWALWAVPELFRWGGRKVGGGDSNLAKALGHTIGWAPMFGILYWLGWVGVLEMNVVYRLMVMLAIVAVITLSPIGGWMRSRVRGWAWVKKDRERRAAKELGGMRKNIAKAEEDLEEMRGALAEVEEKALLEQRGLAGIGA